MKKLTVLALIAAFAAPFAASAAEQKTEVKKEVTTEHKDGSVEHKTETHESKEAK